MKTILLAIVLLLSGSMVSAQITPETLLKKTPSLPKDSCNISRADKETFVQQVNALLEETDNEITRLNQEIDKAGSTNEERARETALKQMSQQYGMSEEDIAKMKNAKNLSAADKQALANNMMMKQANMTMDEAKNLSKLDDAGKKAYAEALATEKMAEVQANPTQYPVNNTGKNMQALVVEQQTLTGKLSANSQKIGNLYASIDNDPSGKEMLRKIDEWHKKLMTMTGIDYGQGKQMDSLSDLIRNEQVKYCSKFTPRYRAALRQHLALVKASIPDYRQLGAINAEMIKMQYGLVLAPENAELGGIKAVNEYLGKLGNAFKYNLFFPEEN